MAEHSNLRDNSARLRRNMSKLAFRSREKVMRSIGRSEETKDEILDHYVMLINKQQIQMQKLQRDMKQYLSALKAMSFSQKAFYDSLYEIYDDDWSGKDVIASCSQRNQMLHDDIFARFQAEVTDVLQNHLAEYLDCKVKVEKRGRKLVDYDAARRSLHSLETAKKPDPSKVEKATEHVQQAKESYESLNNELHDRLPTIYDSRLPICVETFSSICESERLFSNEVAEMHSKLKNVFSSLNTAFEKGEYHIQRMPPPLDNGRVAPSSSDGSTRTSNDSPAKSVVSSQQTPSKSHNDDALPPRYPGEALPSSPSSDPSSHEYVNLQIGPLSDVVQPVTEEEENGTQNNADKIKSEIGYLSPNVANKREEVGYIMASDPSLSRNSVPAKISRPQPSPRSQIFRNPSDAKISRPPIPKPLPRTLSAPTTKRPSHLKQNHQSMHGNWKGPRDQYTDVHLRSTNGHKTKSTSSHQRQEQKRRPISMYVPAVSKELSVMKIEESKSKDDGSGTVTTKTIPPSNEKTNQETRIAEEEPKPKKGLFGFMGFKKKSMKKSSNMSVATPPNSPVKTEKEDESQKDKKVVEEPKFEMVKKTSIAPPELTIATAAAVREDAVYETVTTEADVEQEDESHYEDIQNENDNQEIDVTVQGNTTEEAESQAKEAFGISDDGATSDQEFDPPSSSVLQPPDETEDVDAAFAKFEKSDHADDTTEGQKDQDAFEKMQEASSNSKEDSKVNAFEVKAELQKLPLENDPVFSEAVNTSNTIDHNSFNIPPSDFEDPNAFGDVSATSVHTPDSINEAFSAPSNDPIKESADSGFEGRDLFGSEPFECVIEEDQDDGKTTEDPFSESGRVEYESPMKEKFDENLDEVFSKNTDGNFQNAFQDSSQASTQQVFLPEPAVQQNEAATSINDPHLTGAQIKTRSLPEEDKPQNVNGDAFTSGFDMNSHKEDIEEPVKIETDMLKETQQSLEQPPVEVKHSQDGNDDAFDSNLYTNLQRGNIKNSTELREDFKNITQQNKVQSSLESEKTPVNVDAVTSNSGINLQEGSVKEPTKITQQMSEEVGSDIGVYSASFGNPTQDSKPQLDEPLRPLDVDLSDDDESDDEFVTAENVVKVKDHTGKENTEHVEEYTKQATMTANGDHISFQPIYEEPPNEEDLPSFQKEQKEKQSVPKSPTKSDDSQKYLDLPPDYLFSVQALYQYKSTDDDELGFDKGEVVHIVKHPDPEEQDEGWQMGVRQKDWEENGSSAGMGVFPENFTKRIQL